MRTLSRVRDRLCLVLAKEAVERGDKRLMVCLFVSVGDVWKSAGVVCVDRSFSLSAVGIEAFLSNSSSNLNTVS